MHVEKRTVGKRFKYFLAHSYREGSKVYKFRKYLGQDLKQAELEGKMGIAEKLILEEIHKYRMINDPLRVEISEKEMSLVKNLETKIKMKIHHLSEQEWKDFSKIFTYNTNAIEGSRLSQKEVAELLEENKWPNKSKEDIAEAFGVDEAISYIRRTKEPISIAFIRKIHKIIFRNSKPFAGSLRKRGEDVVVIDNKGNVVHAGAPHPRVNHLLGELADWYESNKAKYSGLILAATVHNQFENIHPFRDGNGRVGRILLNYILIMQLLPPINIDIRNRGEYYASLQAYEKYHDLKPTIQLFMKEYTAYNKKMELKPAFRT